MAKRMVATSGIESASARIAANAFADAVGEDQAKIRVVDPQWRELLSACCRVEPHVTRWRAETTLTLADLGIAPGPVERKALESVISLGNRYLLPIYVIERGQHLENKFRNALWKRSIPSHWGNLVPQQQYSAWKAEAEEIARDYKEWALDVFNCWDELMLKVEDDYRELGYRAWCRLAQSVVVPLPQMDEWVPAFVQRCMAKVETKEYWLAKAKMWFDASYIPLRSLLAEDEAEAAHVAAVAQAKTEMERDILNSARSQFETGLFQFMSDVRGELTERIFNVLVDVLTAMDRTGGHMPGNSSKQLKNLISAVEDLKFWDDKQLDAQMASLRSIMDQRSATRDYGELQDVMRQIGAEARILLSELGRPATRRSRQVGIPELEIATGPLSRQPRRALDINDAIAIEPVARVQRTLEVALA